LTAISQLLRAEWLALAIAGVALFVANGGPWWLLLPALLAPDLSMAGYLAGPWLGAITYNSVHNLVVGLAAIGAGWWADASCLVLAGSILLAHVGMDRSLGYGLKLPSGFKDTHLGRIGR
jgi:hypothetical protein